MRGENTTQLCYRQIPTAIYYSPLATGSILIRVSTLVAALLMLLLHADEGYALKVNHIT